MKTEKRQSQNSFGSLVQEAPDPDPGISRIEIDAEVPIFQIILGRNLSGSNGKAVWIDSGNEASTYALASAGNQEIMQRVKIGRAFTAFQHFHLVNRIEEFLEPETEYIVLPNIDQQYREGVSEKESQDLFQDLLAKLESIKSERPEIRILYSFFREDTSQIVLQMKSMTDESVEIERSSQGLRRKSKREETMFYSKPGFIQTTIPYWRRKRFENPENTVRVNYSGENELDV
ncbi:MAG: hypothetical protein ABEJ36_06590 [Candidatus Nanosalina sp.]